MRIELPTITPEHVDLMVKDLSTIGRLASTDKAAIILAATTSPNPGPGPGPDAPNATISDAGSG